MSIQKEMLVEKLHTNVLRENTSGDVSVIGQLILPLIQKLYTETLINQLADVQPVTSPVGKVACLHSVYNGTETTPISHPDNSYIVYTTPVASGFAVGDIITEDVSSATYKILYIEDEKVLLTMITGSHVIAVGDTFDTSALEVTYATPNRVAIKKLFKNYSGSYAYKNDDNTTIKSLSFESRTKAVETVARKLKSKFSFEQIQDWVAVYNEKGVELGSKVIANEINHEIDKEFIDYLKFISKYTILPPYKVELSKSIAVGGGGLKDVTDDLILNIFLAAEQIVRDVKRNRTIFVLADPVTCAFLQTNAFVTKAEHEEENPYRVGKLGNYQLFSDLFAEAGEYYVIVGYQGSNEGDGDAGVIFAPYTNTLHTVDSGDMKTNMLSLNRYAIVRHPQDTGNKNDVDIWDSVNASNSDFFKMFIVDYGTLLINFTDANKSLANFE